MDLRAEAFFFTFPDCLFERGEKVRNLIATEIFSTTHIPASPATLEDGQ